MHPRSHYAAGVLAALSLLLASGCATMPMESGAGTSDDQFESAAGQAYLKFIASQVRVEQTLADVHRELATATGQLNQLTVLLDLGPAADWPDEMRTLSARLLLTSDLIRRGAGELADLESATSELAAQRGASQQLQEAAREQTLKLAHEWTMVGEGVSDLLIQHERLARRAAELNTAYGSTASPPAAAPSRAPASTAGTAGSVRAPTSAPSGGTGSGTSGTASRDPTGVLNGVGTIGRGSGSAGGASGSTTPDRGAATGGAATAGTASSQTASTSRPEPYPWEAEPVLHPIPKPSSFATIDPELRLGRGSYREIAQRLEVILRELGYSERSYYRLQGRGFALACRLEQIDETGAPVAPPARWSIASAPMHEFSIAEYLRRLFQAQPGRYRVVVILVTPDNVQFGDRQLLTPDDASALLQGGSLALPRSVATAPVPAMDVDCYALIYEFHKKAAPDEPRFISPGLTALDQLTRSGFFAAIKSAFP